MKLSKLILVLIGLFISTNQIKAQWNPINDPIEAPAVKGTDSLVTDGVLITDTNGTSAQWWEATQKVFKDSANWGAGGELQDLQSVLTQGSTATAATLVVFADDSIYFALPEGVQLNLKDSALIFTGLGDDEDNKPLLFKLKDKSFLQVDGSASQNSINNNTALGYEAFYNRNDFSSNTAMGHQALSIETDTTIPFFDNNTAVGYRAGYNSLNNGTFIGALAGNNSKNSGQSSFIGTYAGQSAYNSPSTVAIGRASYFNTDTSRSASPLASVGKNVFVGAFSGRGGSFSNTVAIGQGVVNPSSTFGSPSVDAFNSVFIGSEAGLSFPSTDPEDDNNSYFNNSIMIGPRAGELIDSCNTCIAIGGGRLSETDRLNVDSIIAIGEAYNFDEYDYSNYIAIGHYVRAIQDYGVFLPDWDLFLGGVNKSEQWDSAYSSSNILNGFLKNNSVNEIVIGSDAIGNGDNTITLGNDNHTDTYLKGDVNMSGYLGSESTNITLSSVILSANVNNTTAFTFNPINSTFNPNGANVDFIVESSVDNLNFIVDGFTGFIGIGRNDPQDKVHIQSDLATLLRTQSTDTSARIAIENSLGSAYVTKQNNSLSIGADSTATTNNITILSNGNVGIGELSPQYPLHINTSPGNIVAGFESGDVQSYVSFFDNTTSSQTEVLIGARGDDMELWAGSAERIRIKADGNVGIGTNNPTSKLDVSGSIETDVYMYFGDPDTDGSWRIGPDSGTGNLVISVRVSGVWESRQAFAQ